MTHSHDREVLLAAVAVLQALGEAKRAESIAALVAELGCAVAKRFPSGG